MGNGRGYLVLSAVEVLASVQEVQVDLNATFIIKDTQMRSVEDLGFLISPAAPRGLSAFQPCLRDNAGRARRDCETGLAEAIGHIINQTAGVAEDRWSPRIPFVHPARLVDTEEMDGKRTAGGTQERFSIRSAGFEAMTTDISLEEVGIVTLFGFCGDVGDRVLLRTCGATFECEIRQAGAVGCLLHQYGLRFCHVLGASTEQDRAL
jgi:hypothetical protein